MKRSEYKEKIRVKGKGINIRKRSEYEEKYTSVGVKQGLINGQ